MVALLSLWRRTRWPLSGQRFFGQHDWYREGAEVLLKVQNQRTGAWVGVGLYDRNQQWPRRCTAVPIEGSGTRAGEQAQVWATEPESTRTYLN